jgi:TatD DNase family protein
MYVDAHCHLERETYGAELEDVIARARAAGLQHFIAVGASGVSAGARQVVALAEAHPFVSAAVGIHPHEAAGSTPAHEAVIAELIGHPRVVALGEIGLDYHYDSSPRPVQREVFARLLALARDRNVPVMLHVREAHEDTWAILDRVGLPARGGVVHCFTGGPDEAREYLARGMMLSIPGVITFKNAAPLREAVRAAPLDRLLIETDCPYLAPIPYRGKRNEPAYLVATAAAVGALKGLTGEALGEATRQNAQRFFGLTAG